MGAFRKSDDKRSVLEYILDEMEHFFGKKIFRFFVAFIISFILVIVVGGFLGYFFGIIGASTLGRVSLYFAAAGAIIIYPFLKRFKRFQTKKNKKVL